MSNKRIRHEELSEPQTAVMMARKALILNMAGQGSGKSRMIGIISGLFITIFPDLLGFIAANTEKQLSQSTLARVMEVWAEVYGMREFDPKRNPEGYYVINKKPPAHFLRKHYLADYRGTISFYNGAMIYIGSLENYKAHDGKQFAWAHLDETKDTKEEALKTVILGRLRQYGFWYDKVTGDLAYDDQIAPVDAAAAGLEAWNPCYIHTSPAIDGVDWLPKLFNLEPYRDEIKTEVMKREFGFFQREFDNKAVVIWSTFHNAHNLPPNYITNLILSLGDDEQVLKLVYGYPFSKSGGEYYPYFDRTRHAGKVPFLPGVMVHLSFDFNVVPYMTMLAAQVEYFVRWLAKDGVTKYDTPDADPDAREIEVMRIRVYKGYFKQPPENTAEACCVAFKGDHSDTDGNPTVDLCYHGDANGANRIDGLGNVTRYDLVRDALGYFCHSGSNCVTVPNVLNAVRRDLLNKIFSGKLPQIEIIIDEEVEELVKDCEKVKLGPKGKVKNLIQGPPGTGKYQQYGHATDALEYLVCDLCKHLAA